MNESIDHREITYYVLMEHILMITSYYIFIHLYIAITATLARHYPQGHQGQLHFRLLDVLHSDTSRVVALSISFLIMIL